MKHILCLLILTSLISCDKIKSLTSNNTFIEPEKPEVIFEKYKSSVVLIATQYYFELNIGGYVFYYSPNTEIKIFSEEEDVLKNLSSTNGTGFIISINGEIITNNHVVNPKSENFKDDFSIYCDTEKSRILEEVSDYNDTITYYDNNILPAKPNMTPSDAYTIDLQYDNYVNQKKSFIDYYEILDKININNSSSKLVIYKLGVAYNDTRVDNVDDLQECTVIKLSDIENVDLALIQTNTQTFNIKPNNIFNFNDNNPNVAANPEEFAEREILKPVNINDDVFMIGYNRGFSLANTQLGIKSQFTSGKISQECDGVRILYTIPTLEGSSGSPVVDKWGNLVGVNFAKLTDTQSFGFAIPVYELKKFYEH